MKILPTAKVALSLSKKSYKRLHNMDTIMDKVKDEIESSIKEGCFKTAVYVGDYKRNIIDTASSIISKRGYKLKLDGNYLTINWNDKGAV